MTILDEASQVIAYSRQLEQKSRELEAATAELRAANERLKELDRLKDDFVSTVTHELRTPLTSIRAFSEILHDNPDLDLAERKRFLGIIIKETERLTRLINQVLDLAKIESGNAEWHSTELDMREVISDAVRRPASSLIKDKRVRTGPRTGRRPAARDGRPRPPDAGDAEPAVQRGEILSDREGRVDGAAVRESDNVRVDVATTAPASSPTTRSSSSRSSARWATR